MMNHATPTLLAVFAVLAAGVGVGTMPGCATTKHDVAPASGGKVSVCTKCYDEVRTVRDSRGRNLGPPVERTLRTHMCDECKSEMTIYESGGVLKVRCPACAPEGVDCDRCVPKVQAK